MTVNILGTEYSIETHKWDEDKTLKKNSYAAYCCDNKPLIVISDMDDEDRFIFHDSTDKNNYYKSCLRHEIVHAFLNESGLSNNSNECERWATNEEMVDWMAIQFPKILIAFKEVGCI